jgi:hypothetical protein
MSVSKLSGWLGAAMLLSGCVVGTAGPVHVLPTPEQAGSWTYGGWVEVSAKGKAPVQGELIAVARDTAWILDGPLAIAVPRSDIVSGRVIGYDSETNKLFMWAILGPVATLSNGPVLLLSLPAWVITGAVATHKQRGKPILELTAENWNELAKYARFPQGAPPGLDFSRLKPWKPKP